MTVIFAPVMTSTQSLILQNGIADTLIGAISLFRPDLVFANGFMKYLEQAAGLVRS